MIDWSKISSISRSDEIDILIKEINDYSNEQKTIINKFTIAMNNFARDRSFESCLDSLNLAIQLSNIRGKLSKSYEYYSRLLEKDIIKLERLLNKKETI